MSVRAIGAGLALLALMSCASQPARVTDTNFGATVESPRFAVYFVVDQECDADWVVGMFKQDDPAGLSSRAKSMEIDLVSFTGPGSKGNFDYGHLWFLLYLFVFSALALPFFLILNRRGGSSRTLSAAKRLCGGALVLLPALWIAALEALFRPGWPGFQDLINDWANFTVYLSFFVFGFIAGSAPGLLEAMERNRLTALLAGIAAFIARLGVYRLFDVPPGWSAANMATQAFRGGAAWFIVVAAMGYGRRFLNQESRALSAARDLSFPLYLLHFVFLTAATYLLLGSTLPVWPRWAISVAAAWLCVAFITAGARHVPVVRDFFGVKRSGKPNLKAPGA